MAINAIAIILNIRWQQHTLYKQWLLHCGNSLRSTILTLQLQLAIFSLFWIHMIIFKQSYISSTLKRSHYFLQLCKNKIIISLAKNFIISKSKTQLRMYQPYSIVNYFIDLDEPSCLCCLSSIMHGAFVSPRAMKIVCFPRSVTATI